MTYFTHSGLFHCDEVAGYAICRLAGVSNSLIRLTDITELPDSDHAIIADIGREYDPEKNRYDHHQDFLTRPNNYPYASAGLLWKQYGMQAIEATVGPKSRTIIKPIERPEWFTGFIHQGKWIAGGETVEILLELAKANLI